MDIATINTNQISTANTSAASSANSTAPRAGTTSTSAEAASAGTAISSDFETFLKMLTVQMQNQDPLNPIESTDYAVQLATFSGVEQQVKTNDLLSAVSAQLGAMSMSDLAGWVGMEARATVPAWFDNKPVTLVPDPASGAQEAYVVVRNTAGMDIDRIQVPISDEPLLWAGVNSSGNPFPVGEYSFYLQSYSEGGMIAEDQIAIYSEIVEARTEDGDTILVLEGGHEVTTTEVGALRAPDDDL